MFSRIQLAKAKVTAQQLAQMEDDLKNENLRLEPIDDPIRIRKTYLVSQSSPVHHRSFPLSPRLNNDLHHFTCTHESHALSITKRYHFHPSRMHTPNFLMARGPFCFPFPSVILNWHTIPLALSASSRVKRKPLHTPGRFFGGQI